MGFLVIIYILAWLSALSGSPTGWGIVIFGTIVIIGLWVINQGVENHSPTAIDQSKLSKDVADGVGVWERRRRYASGYYDKKK